MRVLTLTTLFFIALGLTGCASDPQQGPMPIAELGYINVNQSGPTDIKSINNIRYQALQETASRIGAQGGLAWRARQINYSLSQSSKYLSNIFDFSQLLINNNVLPPVIAETDGNISLDNPDTIRVANKTYKIITSAHFVTTAPTWRSYLWMDYPKPDEPSITLLPKDPAEASVWNFYIKQGWKKGLEQANAIFKANLSRLKRDYLGMVLYRKLLAEHMITAPNIAKASLGVTGNSQEVHIDDRIYRITSHSALIPNSQAWQPVITKEESKDE